MGSTNELRTLESDREAVLGLQELPEYGGTALPDLRGQTSWISIMSDCSGASTSVTTVTVTTI